MRISDWSSDVCSSDLASGYLLKPVGTAAVQVVSGSIDGYVASADGETLSAAVGTQVYAEQDGIVVRGTITDSDGHFILSPLEQSSAVGNYDVVIAGATTATNIVSDVPVSAQTQTSSEARHEGNENGST